MATIDEAHRGSTAPEARCDGEGMTWRLVAGPFERPGGQRVVVASLGWNEGGVVKGELFVPEWQWLGWDVVTVPAATAAVSGG